MKRGAGVLTMLGVFLVLACLARPALASFHAMQIEQAIAGVNGNTAEQAIQLRMRALGQNLLFSAGSVNKLVAYDATGANPVTLVTFGHDVANGLVGSTVLVTTSGFPTSPALGSSADFLMTNPIPASYLPAGRLTYESSFFGVLWSIAWGGASYTGPTTGSTINDLDGNFGKLAGTLPTAALQALLFNGPASALSTTNSADYSVTAGAAVFTNNAGASFTVSPIPGDFNSDGHVDVADLMILAASWAKSTGNPGFNPACDLNNDGSVNVIDLLILANSWGT